MRFLHPSFLVLIPVALLFAAFAYWSLLRARRGLESFMPVALRERLVPGSARDAAALQTALLAAALVLLAVAVARPQWGRANAPVRTRGRNLLIALDVSRSMLAADVHPNRLERARVDIMDLLGDLGGDRAGLLVFRGKANMICPLTTDRAFLRQALDGVTIDSAPRGETDLADAIRKSVTAFDGMGDENNAIILISDGEDLAGHARAAAEVAGARSIPIFTVGIGDPSGAEVPSADGPGAMKYKGQTVRSKMTESTLREIASASGGAYIPLATSSTASTTLGAIYRQHLAKIAAKEIEEMIENRLVERYQLFLIPGLVLLLAAASLSRGRLARASRRASAAVAAAIALLLPPGASADSYADAAWAAQRYFRSGDFTNAAPTYLDAASRCDDPERARELRYNSALASYKTGDMAAAAEALSSIYSHPRLAKAAELFGAAELAIAGGPAGTTNAALRAEALERASDGFAGALRAAPGDARARRNLARAATGIGAAREAARIEAALAKHGGKPPQVLVNELLSEERGLMKTVAGAAEDENAEHVIATLEDAAERQREAGGIWIPLKQMLVDSGAITNEEQRAEVARAIETSRDAMASSADLLDDLSPEAYPLIARSENAAYAFWKSLSEPPALIAEDILVQTNAYSSPDSPLYPLRPDWEEALSLTSLFAERFPAWAEQVIQQRQADTNAPPFTAEDAAKITELADELKWLQKDSVENRDANGRRSAALEALDRLEKIRALLPKNKSQSQQQQQQNQNQDQQQDQQDQQNQQDQQDQNQQQQQQDEQQQEQNADQKPEQDEEHAADASDEDIEEALRKALEREKEHDRDKQRRMRAFPLSPGEKDW